MKNSIELKVYWDDQDRNNAGWAYRLVTNGESTDSGEVGVGASDSLDDAIDQACHELNIDATHDDFAKLDDHGVYRSDLTDDDNMLTVKVDEENNAEEFWSNLRKQLPNLATRFGSHNSEVEMEASEWESVQAIEGFFGGPDHAPAALILCGG